MPIKDSDLDSLVKALGNEIARLDGKTQVFLQLMGLEREVAERAFRRLPSWQKIHLGSLFEAICLSVGRILDSPGSGERENASMRALLRMAEKNLCRENYLRLLNECAEITVAAEPMLQWRNKIIAHKDLTHCLEGFFPPDVSPDLIREITERLKSLMHKLNFRLRGEDMVYDLGLYGDGNQLVRILLEADEHRECIRSRLLSPKD